MTPLALRFVGVSSSGRQPGRIGISLSRALESCPLGAYLLVPKPLTPDGHSVLSSPLLGFTLQLQPCLQGRTFPAASASWSEGNADSNRGEKTDQLPTWGRGSGDPCASPRRWYLLP